MIALLLLALLQDPRPETGWKVSIDAAEKVFVPGQPFPIRFLVENPTDQEMELPEPVDYTEGLEITAPDQKVVKTFGKTKDVGKIFRSDGRGFLGRTVDVAKVLTVPEDREGWYRFRWQLGDAVSAPIQVFVVRDYLADLETNYGTVTVELFPAEAPNHVKNFVDLVRSEFYNGTKFHRVIPGFMMQGGGTKDPDSVPKPRLKAEIGARRHETGTLSMAHLPKDPDSAATEFFLCFRDLPHLDGQYTVFGRMVEGEKVLREIESVRTDHNPCRGCREEHPPGPTKYCGAPGHHSDAPEVDVILKKATLRVREKKP